MGDPQKTYRSWSLGLAFVLAMATIVTSPSESRAQGVVARLQGFRDPILLDTLVFAREKTGAPMAATFAALRDVYKELRLPLDLDDARYSRVGSFKLRLTGRLGGERLSTYFNCGRGMTGENADTWRLSIAMATFLRPSGPNDTEMGTGLVANAQDMGGAAKDQVMCGSSGYLKARLVRLVREKLAASPAAKP